MSTDVLELEQAQERKLQDLEDAALTAEWKRSEEPTIDPALRARRLAAEAQGLLKAMAHLCEEYWGHGVSSNIRNIPAAVARLRQRLNRGAAAIARALELAQAFAGASGGPVPEADDLVQLLPQYRIWVEETMERSLCGSNGLLMLCIPFLRVVCLVGLSV